MAFWRIGSLSMKEPRVNDFDPKAPQLKSSLEDMPPIANPSIRTAKETLRRVASGTGPSLLEATRESPSVSTPEPPPVRTPVRVKRTITRYAFEFFQDQIETLKKFSLDEQLSGEKGSMSQMVREALDAYIAKRM